MASVIANPAASATRALLIGVGDYPNLKPELRLAAPAGDVRRLSEALVAAGLDGAAVETLTEQGPMAPTRAAILERLAALADGAQAGDRVLVYFSGHGAQAPARRPDREIDGLEELYLAADARGWDGSKRRVPGAIADFEMEAALSAIRAKGADVWFVADSCHAAGLMRGASDGRPKSVSGADLGIPSAALRGANPSAEISPLAATGGRGRFTGFYAAAPGSLAVERLLPSGSAEAQPSSTFTFALVRAMNQGRFRSFRDLAQAATAASAQTGPGAPAPVFEGALGETVLGLAPARRAFAVRRADTALVVEAGVLEGFEPGAEVSVRNRAAGWTSPARVAAAGPLSASLVVAGPVPDGPLMASLDRPAPLPSADAGARLLWAVSGLSGEAARDLKVEARLWRGGCGPNPPAALGWPAGAEPMDLLAAPALRHCDVLYFRLANAGPAALDVSPLYVDAEGTIVALTLAPLDSPRISAGAERFAAVRLLTRDARGRPLPAGVEHLTLLASPADTPEPLDLRTLAGPTAVTRSGLSATGPANLSALIFALRLTE